jgi:hypothetical protein
MGENEMGKMESPYKKCSEIFIPFMRPEEKNEKQSEESVHRTHVHSTHIWYCLLLCFGFCIVNINLVEEFHPYAGVHYKQSRAFLQLLEYFSLVFIAPIKPSVK